VINIARIYHTHQVTNTDGIYSHKIEVTHRSIFGKAEHQKELNEYKKDTSLWRAARSQIKDLVTSVSKYRTHVKVTGLTSITALILVLTLIPGGSFTGDDVYCGANCESLFNYTNWKYDITVCDVGELVNVTFDKQVKDYQVYMKIEDAWVDKIEGCIRKPRGSVWEFKMIVEKDEMSSPKWTAVFGDAMLDPYLISEVKKIGSVDRDNLDGTRTVTLGVTNVKENGKWKDPKNAKSLLKAEETPYSVKYLEQDNRWNVTVHDFNMTWINLTVESKEKEVKVRLNEWNKTTNLKIKAGDYEYYGDILSYDNISFGDASTTIQLQDAGTENINDAQLSDSSPNYSFGNSAYIYISGVQTGESSAYDDYDTHTHYQEGDGWVQSLSFSSLPYNITYFYVNVSDCLSATTLTPVIYNSPRTSIIHTGEPIACSTGTELEMYMGWGLNTTNVNVGFISDSNISISADNDGELYGYFVHDGSTWTLISNTVYDHMGYKYTIEYSTGCYQYNTSIPNIRSVDDVNLNILSVYTGINISCYESLINSWDESSVKRSDIECNGTMLDWEYMSSPSTWYSWNVTDGTYNGSQENMTYCLNATSSDAVYTRSYSKEYSTASYRPYLNITYTPEGDFPLYSDDGDNSSLYSPVKFGDVIGTWSYWSDTDTNLDVAEFYHNVSGSMSLNDTCDLSGVTEGWCNKTITISEDMVEKTICWKQYCNDTIGLKNETMGNSEHCFDVQDLFPRWSNNQTNTTTAGSWTKFSSYWKDDIEVSGCIFGLCNGTLDTDNVTCLNISYCDGIADSCDTHTTQEVCEYDDGCSWSGGGIDIIVSDTFTDFSNWTTYGDCASYWHYGSSTPSSLTGPQSGDSDDDGSNFAYMESSSGSCDGSPSEGYLIFNQEIDWDSYTGEEFYIETNFYGTDANLGELSLEENSTGDWVYVGLIAEDDDGNDGDVWTPRKLDLSSLTGSGNIRLHLNETASYRGDAAFDRFNISGGGGDCSGTAEACGNHNDSQTECSAVGCDWNQIGGWVNDSWIATTDWFNVTKYVNETVGSTIGWQQWCNDTSDNWNSTDIFSYDTTSTGTPDINLSYGPPDTTSFIWNGCSPDWENVTSEPNNQTSTYGIDLVCNNGSAIGDVQVKLSGALNDNWTIWADNESTFGVPKLTLTTNYQTIYNDLVVDDCTYVWFRANCSYVHIAPGAYEIYRVI